MWTGRQTRTHTAMCVLSGSAHTHTQSAFTKTQKGLSLSLSHTHTHTQSFHSPRHNFILSYRKVSVSLSHTLTQTHIHTHTQNKQKTHKKQALIHPNRIMVLPRINLLKPFTAYPNSGLQTIVLLKPRAFLPQGVLKNQQLWCPKKKKKMPADNTPRCTENWRD